MPTFKNDNFGTILYQSGHLKAVSKGKIYLLNLFNKWWEKLTMLSSFHKIYLLSDFT